MNETELALAREKRNLQKLAEYYEKDASLVDRARSMMGVHTSESFGIIPPAPKSPVAQAPKKSQQKQKQQQEQKQEKKREDKQEQKQEEKPHPQQQPQPQLQRHREQYQSYQSFHQQWQQQKQRQQQNASSIENALPTAHGGQKNGLLTSSALAGNPALLSSIGDTSHLPRVEINPTLVANASLNETENLAQVTPDSLQLGNSSKDICSQFGNPTDEYLMQPYDPRQLFPDISSTHLNAADLSASAYQVTGIGLKKFKDLEIIDKRIYSQAQSDLVETAALLANDFNFTHTYESNDNLAEPGTQPYFPESYHTPLPSRQNSGSRSKIQVRDKHVNEDDWNFNLQQDLPQIYQITPTSSPSLMPKLDGSYRYNGDNLFNAVNDLQPADETVGRSGDSLELPGSAPFGVNEMADMSVPCFDDSQTSSIFQLVDEAVARAGSIRPSMNQYTGGETVFTGGNKNDSYSKLNEISED